MSLLAEILSQFLENVKLYIITKQEQSGKVASGKSIGSYEVEVDQIGSTTVGQLTGVDYFHYVDNGRGPGGFPPIQMIRQWADNKGILNNITKEYQKKSVTYAIALSIARNGTKVRSIGLLDVVTPDRLRALDESILNDKESEIITQLRDIIK